MVKLEKAFRQSEVKNWGSGNLTPELRQKTIKGLGYTWRVELIYHKNTGGIINIWELEDDYIHTRGLSDDGKWYKFNEIHFWGWENALDEYKGITDVSSLLDICKRNG